MSEIYPREVRSANHMIYRGGEYKHAYVYVLIRGDAHERYRIGEISDSNTYNCYASSRKGEVHFTPDRLRELAALLEMWLDQS